MGMTKLVGETRTMRANPPSHVDTARVIAAKGLTFGYSRVAVLADVSFSVNKGDFVSILGPSGCGKSTLLLLAAGRLTARPDERGVGNECDSQIIARGWRD